jgi:hypothetical protein
LEVPAGFRRSSSQQNLFGKTINSSLQEFDSGPVTDDLDNITFITSTDISSDPIVAELSSDLMDTNLSANVINPLVVRSVDKASSSLASKVSITQDYIHACTGFRKIDTVCKHFSELYQDTVKIHNTPPDAVLDDGLLSTMQKKARNTT